MKNKKSNLTYNLLDLSDCNEILEVMEHYELYSEQDLKKRLEYCRKLEKLLLQHYDSKIDIELELLYII